MLSAAAIDDNLNVILLTVLYDFSLAGKVEPNVAFRVAGFIALFFALVP